MIFIHTLATTMGYSNGGPQTKPPRQSPIRASKSECKIWKFTDCRLVEQKPKKCRWIVFDNNLLSNFIRVFLSIEAFYRVGQTLRSSEFLLRFKHVIAANMIYVLQWLHARLLL